MNASKDSWIPWFAIVYAHKQYWSTLCKYAFPVNVSEKLHYVQELRDQELKHKNDLREADKQRKAMEKDLIKALKKLQKALKNQGDPAKEKRLSRLLQVVAAQVGYNKISWFSYLLSRCLFCKLSQTMNLSVYNPAASICSHDWFFSAYMIGPQIYIEFSPKWAV